MSCVQIPHFCGSERQPTATEMICELVRGVPAKVLARVTGRSPKTAEKWKAGHCAMNAEAIFALAREYDDVRAIVMQECGVLLTIGDAVAQTRRMNDMLENRSVNAVPDHHE